MHIHIKRGILAPGPQLGGGALSLMTPAAHIRQSGPVRETILGNIRQSGPERETT